MSKQLDPETLKVLTESRRKFLGFLRSKVGDEATAEDLLQQSLLRAVRSGGTLRKKDTVLAWFYRVLKNAVIDYYRHRAADSRKIDAVSREIEALEKHPTQEQQNEVCRCMHKLLPAMNPAYAELVRRVDLNDEDPQAVGKKLGLTRNNITVRLHRARKALKTRLEEACGSCAKHGCLNCSCNI